MKHLDLFSGIGGFTLTANLAGFETVGFSEVDPFCDSVLKKHWPGIPNFGDIQTLNYTDHIQLITGGFPCQPFSIAGKRKGKDDERYLWREMYRLIRSIKPCWVVAENVTGIVSLALDDILSGLEKENYTTKAFVIPACAANAPHRRDRLWIIANRHSERCIYCLHSREAGHIQINEKRHLSTIQSQWEKFKPIAWSTNKAKDWLEFNARISREDDGLSSRMDKNRIKALGNAIVPQVAYPILALIHSLELQTYEQKKAV